eukprot:gb/GECH01009814.1/.p1 GENE.gb/GECH01009814.1/~~gb/GECH01009814.1/.p1  ORF type:complete len:348 (+),score=79.35 gb/GECH01009814.1/:1-1044(+)
MIKKNRNSSSLTTNTSQIKENTKLDCENKHSSLLFIFYSKFLSLTSSFSLILTNTRSGITDALDFIDLFRVIYRSSTISKLVLYCVFLNGVIFIGSLVLDRFFITPFLSNQYDDPINNSHVNNNHHHHQNNFENTKLFHFNSLSFFYRVIFMLMWIIPIYSISFFLNAKWYQQIAQHVYDGIFIEKKQKIKKNIHLKQNNNHTRNTNNNNLKKQNQELIQLQKSKQNQIQSSSSSSSLQKRKGNLNLFENYASSIETTAQELLRLAVVGIYLLQTLATAAFPFIGGPLTFLFVSWLNAFYSFEYKWTQRNIPLATRIRHFHKHWDYFLGFVKDYMVSFFHCLLFWEH